MSEPCPEGFEAPHFSECFSPFRYCSIKGCGRSERDDEPAAAMSSESPSAVVDRVIRSICPYLPSIHDVQIVVDFCCGCWQGSRSDSFCYICPEHQPKAQR
jgi:hypothetical protein